MDNRQIVLLVAVAVVSVSGMGYLLDVGSIQCRMASNCMVSNHDINENFEFDIRVNKFQMNDIDDSGGLIGYEANISNPRDGLRGVPMRDISYTISLKDGSEQLCSTGKIEELERLRPGSSWLLQPSEEAFDSLTYENCGLDNRSGENLEAELNLEYSYSTTSTFSRTTDGNFVGTSANLPVRSQISFTEENQEEVMAILKYTTSKPVNFKIQKIKKPNRGEISLDSIKIGRKYSSNETPSASISIDASKDESFSVRVHSNITVEKSNLTTVKVK